MSQHFVGRGLEDSQLDGRDLEVLEDGLRLDDGFTLGDDGNVVGGGLGVGHRQLGPVGEVLVGGDRAGQVHQGCGHGVEGMDSVGVGAQVSERALSDQGKWHVNGLSSVSQPNMSSVVVGIGEA